MVVGSTPLLCNLPRRRKNLICCFLASLSADFGSIPAPTNASSFTAAIRKEVISPVIHSRKSAPATRKTKPVLVTSAARTAAITDRPFNTGECDMPCSHAQATLRLISLWNARSVEDPTFQLRVRLSDVLRREVINTVIREDLFREYDPPDLQLSYAFDCNWRSAMPGSFVLRGRLHQVKRGASRVRKGSGKLTRLLRP